MKEKKHTLCDAKTELGIKEIRKVTWLGLAVNLILAVFKMAAGHFGSSQAIVADGVHSLSDTSTDIALLIGVKYWSAPPDKQHPHGHRRIETAITALIGMVLAFVAVGLCYNSLVTFSEVHTKPPELIALIAAIVSIFSKELLYRWNVMVGKKLGSSALVANAWHHRSDGLSSIPAALAVTGAMFLPDWYFLDHVGAVLVSIFILQAAWKISWPAIKELTDWGADPDICEQIENLSLETEGVLDIHKCRTRQLGNGFQVDIHIQVAPDLSVREGHNIAAAVKHKLLEEGPEIIDVITHLEPFEDEDSN